MIKNQKQYRTTKSQAERLRATLAQISQEPSSRRIHPLLRKAEQDALRSQLRDLEAEVREYESLKSSGSKKLAKTTLDDLPRTLIQARIAKGLTQADLANRLGMKEQQIQRYEATNYSSASLARVQAVAKALGLRWQATASVA